MTSALEAWRKENRERMARIREEKAARGECRQCSKKAVILPDGRVLRHCEEHREADRKRAEATARARGVKPRQG